MGHAGLVGTTHSNDFNDSVAPPLDLTKAPLGPDARQEAEPGSRWIEALVIE